MGADADALPLVLERRTQQWRHAVARPVERRGEVLRRGFSRTGLEFSQPYDVTGVIVVATAWLAFYIVAAAHLLPASAH